MRLQPPPAAEESLRRNRQVHAPMWCRAHGWRAQTCSRCSTVGAARLAMLGCCLARRPACSCIGCLLHGAPPLLVGPQNEHTALHKCYVHCRTRHVNGWMHAHAAACCACVQLHGLGITVSHAVSRAAKPCAPSPPASQAMQHDSASPRKRRPQTNVTKRKRSMHSHHRIQDFRPSIWQHRCN